nr:hypothetical protein PJ912_10590 [Pectobacterium colocasium]
MILNKVTDLIGNTPVIQIPVPYGDTRLFLKVEKNNSRRQHEGLHGAQHDCRRAEVRQNSPRRHYRRVVVG